VDLPPEATALLAVPPARFAAEREALARALAGRGDPAAPAVRKLRRPVGLAWVLNRLTRDHPREVRGLLEAGDRLRAGQRRAVSGAGAGALRDADAAVRERARSLRLEAERLLAAAGRPAAAATLARIELLLRVAASGPAREALAAGTLAREPEVGDAGLSGLTILAGGTAPAAATQQQAAPTARRREAPKRAAEDAREVARRKSEHARTVAAAHAEAARARSRAEKAERTAARAEEAAREARERAAQARTEANRATARALEVERTGG